MSIDNTELDVWNDIIYTLNGSCDSLEHILSLYNREDLQDNMEFLGYLDNEIFHCSCCYWWYDISEESGAIDGELTCNNCAENVEEE